MSSLNAFVGFAAVASLSWFFASRPRLFMRVFVPREQVFAAGRHVLRHDEFRRGMRVIAGLQFAVGCVIGVAWLLTR